MKAGVLLMIVVGALPTVSASAQTPQIRGAWAAQIYVMKGGAEHRVEGRIFFTESDWQVVYFVIEKGGKVRRGSAEGGTYTVAGNSLTFVHLHNLSTGGAMEGLEEAPLRMVYRAPEEATEEQSTVRVQGDRLILDFPSGNRLIFTRSSN